ncbi:MAG: flagellar M-ring protein FliF, partial [Acidobacteria bacterium]|nr:flagellar M-ring protein FliF [Acidobacteriota bacterium]
MDPQLLMARLRTLLGSMTPSQLVTLVMTFILVVAVVGGLSWFLTRPNFALVAVDLDPETASGVVAQLQTLNVPYQLDPGGRNVRVPAERVDELRLALTGSGVLTSGQVGWELFDQTSWSQTEFQEQVRMLRALEGEIGRTITSIGEVKAARVNLVIGKRSFIGESEPSKASVLLSLRGRDLPASSISGIANLVAASVPGLRPESVVIMDSQGRALLRPEGDGDDPLGPAQFERQQRMERQMETRIVGLLEPLVGTDRVKAIVALKLNPETSEVMTEEYDPDSVVIRSSSESNQQATSPNLPVGLAGSGGNIPPDPARPTGRLG